MKYARDALVVVALAIGCGTTDASRLSGTPPGGSGGAAQGGASGAGAGGVAGGAQAGADGAGASGGSAGAGATSGGGGDGGAGMNPTGGMGGAGAGGAGGSNAAGSGGTAGAAGALTCLPPDVPGLPEPLMFVDDNNVGELEVDDTTLYWAGSLGIQAIPKGGGPVRLVVNDPGGHTAFSLIESGYLHGRNLDAVVFRVPRDATNATPEILLPWKAGDDWGGVPFIELGPDIYIGGARRVSPGATDSVAIDPLSDVKTNNFQAYWTGTVATDGTSLYWRLEMKTNSGGDKPTHTYGAWIRKLTPPSTVPEDFWTQGDAPFDVTTSGMVARASDKHLCVNSGPTGLDGVGCFELATATVVASIPAEPFSFRIDEPYLYSAPSEPDASGCNSILRGSFIHGTRVRFWSSPGQLRGLAVDGEYVYWHDTFDNMIYRKHK